LRQRVDVSPEVYPRVDIAVKDRLDSTAKRCERL